MRVLCNEREYAKTIFCRKSRESPKEKAIHRNEKEKEKRKRSKGNAIRFSPAHTAFKVLTLNTRHLEAMKAGYLWIE